MVDEYKTVLDKKLEEKGFEASQIIDIKEVIGDTCHYCWDGDSRCQCWNDE